MQHAKANRCRGAANPEIGITGAVAKAATLVARKPVPREALEQFCDLAERWAASVLDANAVAVELGLTPEESRLLQVMLDGVPRARVAAHLGSQEDTVKTHIRAILAKARTKGYASNSMDGLIADLYRQSRRRSRHPVG